MGWDRIRCHSCQVHEYSGLKTYVPSTWDTVEGRENSGPVLRLPSVVPSPDDSRGLLARETMEESDEG